jgi:hypothetical protein
MNAYCDTCSTACKRLLTGHEETRRRSTIQPHVNGVVVEDRRTRALQLLSVGNPSLLLTMCPDYWDGSTISAIPAPLKRGILDMYQQWSLVSSAFDSNVGSAVFCSASSSVISDRTHLSLKCQHMRQSSSE